jgi:hypothetical protein
MLISLVCNDAMTQLPLARARLRCQDVPGKGVAARHFAGPGLLEAFGRTLMCLHLGHKNVLGKIGGFARRTA